MRIYSFFIFLIIVAVSSPLAAQTQGDLNASAQSEFQDADAELNRIYNEILLIYKDNPQFIENLRLAQRAWVKFRDAHLLALYPTRQGSISPMCTVSAKAELTHSRKEQLLKWLNGVEEGDVCSGSVKFDHDLKKGQ